MIDWLLQIIAPHHCSGCTETGTLLCANCKYDIINEPYSRCFACGVGLVTTTGICSSCRVPYVRAWCVGEREDTLQVLINTYKFENARAAYRPLADLLDMYLPELPSNVQIVPIPTVNSHIRQRGYDHMALITRRLASRRRLSTAQVLKRQTSTKQRDAGRRQRFKQAQAAFSCSERLDSNIIYLLVDDVVTTGATMKYAAKTLLDAGATTVWCASISRQTLD